MTDAQRDAAVVTPEAPDNYLHALATLPTVWGAGELEHVEIIHESTL